MFFPIVVSSAFVFLLPTAAKGACTGNFLPCDNGECVRREDWCDGENTCGDKSDEAHCLAKWLGFVRNVCNDEIHWQCDDGRCWPLAARCDGTADCKDDSDEKNCESKAKKSVESDEKTEESDEIKAKSEETKDEDEEDEIKAKSEEEMKVEDDENNSKESPEEEIAESKESSEENGSDEAASTAVTTTISSDDLDEYEYNRMKVSSGPPPSVDAFLTPEDTTPAASFRSPTTGIDFYSNKMKQQYSSQINVHPTRAYRPLPVAHYSTSRKPAVPYTGPTRAYTPRSYRYIGTQYSGQTPAPYRGRHHPAWVPYGSNHLQPYRNLHDDNGRAGVTRPPRVYGRQLRAPSRFYFKKNYNEIYGRANSPSVRRGVEWMLSIRNATGGWGKETPRALVALSLVNNSFLAGNHENDLMQKYFQVHLGVNLLRNKGMSLNRLAMFVNALIATCQNPRDFQGWDLTELIRDTILQLYRKPKTPVINPLVYLSLCLADRNLTVYEVHRLMTYLAATRNDEVTRDMTCLALEAFACHMQKEKDNVAQFHTLQKMVWNATSRILQRMKEDGSFGSVYSTAMAAKALMSVNETVAWDPEPTFRFLKNHQQRNGSFGDFLATYHVTAALSGRSLLHLRNTECDPPRVDRELSPQEILQHPGHKSYIRYSLHMGRPLTTGFTVQLLVPTGISFFDVMRVAAYENDHFKFSYEEVNGKISVYSISDIPNDPEGGQAWRLYIRSPSDTGNIPNIQQLYTGDIRELQPTPDQHVIFWYHALGF